MFSYNYSSKRTDKRIVTMRSACGKKRERSDILPVDRLRLDDLPLDLSSIDSTVVSALRHAERLLHAAACGSAPVHEAAEAADAAREATFPFLEDSAVYSAAYAAASLQVAEAELLRSAAEAPSECTAAAVAALRALDLAMLRGGVDEWAGPAKPLILLASALAAAPQARRREAVDASTEMRRHQLEITCSQFGLPGACASHIPRIDAGNLSVDEFCARHMGGTVDAPPQPVILCNAIADWPAVHGSRRWSFDYLRCVAGTRLVPVETYAAADSTSTYLSASWVQRVMSLGEYIDRYVDTGATEADKADAPGAAEGSYRAGSGGAAEDVEDAEDAKDALMECGYLAQHQLLDQIPTLRNDIRTPAYCTARAAEDLAAPPTCEVRHTPLVSAWIGPAGTVSPLHTDPYHNLLAQVAGYKYIRLYNAVHSPRLYPRSGALCNNSYVDLDVPRPAEQPLVTATPYAECVLGPGEVLYIPRHCWHYVRSLEPSISVSFWWGAKMGLRQRKDGSMETFY